MYFYVRFERYFMAVHSSESSQNYKLKLEAFLSELRRHPMLVNEGFVVGFFDLTRRLERLEDGLIDPRTGRVSYRITVDGVTQRPVEGEIVHAKVSSVSALKEDADAGGFYKEITLRVASYPLSRPVIAVCRDYSMRARESWLTEEDHFVKINEVFVDRGPVCRATVAGFMCRGALLT